jgi:hypothetical protein
MQNRDHLAKVAETFEQGGASLGRYLDARAPGERVEFREKVRFFRLRRHVELPVGTPEA